MGSIQDIWRASGPILSARRGAGETPAIPGGYAIISDARRREMLLATNLNLCYILVEALPACIYVPPHWNSPLYL